MEKKFYPDNFEQLLKENADNFRMYPSKRVWHSIYNDLHPSRKWPSLAIWLLLVSSIVYIGLSNKSKITSPENSSQIIASTTNGSNTVAPDQDPNTTSLNKITGNSTSADLNTTGSITGNNHTVAPNDINDQNQGGQQLVGTTAFNTIRITTPALSTITETVVDDKDLFSEPLNTSTIAGSQKQVVSVSSINSIPDAQNETAALDLITKKPVTETEKKASLKEKNNLNKDKEWMEDYAFHNKPTVSKWKSKTTYQFYFTPSIGYRTLAKNTEYNPVSSLVAPSINVEDYKETLSHVAEVNMEVGANILYSLTKRWNLKAGVQFNYTNYGVNAYELKHPTNTTLLLNDLTNGLPVLEPRSTTLANSSGVTSKRLNNNTFQVSLPLGADIRLAGKKNFKWFAGATIQPTYVIGGNAYLISSDLKNYVADRSFINNWNLNTSVETFVSYKTKSGITINAGPQFRYQVFSTYNSKYTYGEKLYNVGLKLGIITKL